MLVALCAVSACASESLTDGCHLCVGLQSFISLWRPGCVACCVRLATPMQVGWGDLVVNGPCEDPS
jgi:hypothetical protein